MSTKKCPFCAEEILEEAVKCKHCGSMLTSQPSMGTKAPPQDPLMAIDKILEEEVKFNHCGSMLTSQPSMGTKAPPQAPSMTIYNADIRNPRIGKGKIVVGVLIVILGFIMLVSVDETNPGMLGLSVLFLVVGLVLTVVGKFQNWWHWK